jgi:hypothetical protein
MATVSTVFAKLNLKDHSEIVVLDAPESFEPKLSRPGSRARDRKR